MALSRVYDALQNAGSQVAGLVRSQPILHRAVEVIQQHPWTSLGVASGVMVTYKLVTRRRNLPPGPFNYPFVGASCCFDPCLEREFLERRDKYGDIIYFRAMGSDIIFLNSERVIREAFMKRGEEFAHRKESRFFVAIGLDKEEIFTAPYNDEWKSNKKFGVMALKNFGFGTARSEAKIHHCLDKLEKAFLEHKGQAVPTMDYLRKSSCATIFDIYFNEDLPLDDPKIAKLSDAIDNWMMTMGDGIRKVEFLYFNLPWLAKIMCRDAISRGTRATTVLLDHLKEMIKEHRQSLDPSDIRDIIDYYLVHRGDLDDEVIAGNIMVTLPDSIDTTSLVTVWIIFLMAYYQDVQTRMQEEVDRVVGPDRNPSFSDKAKLPYVEAVFLEAQRFTDLIPVTPPRQIQSDMMFDGYLFPQGTHVKASLHSVHYDPKIFPNPRKFDPSRFIDANGKLDQAMASHVMGFSIGRRMCYGEQYAKSKILLSVARFAQRFNVSFDPKQPKPEFKMSPGAYKMPAPHKILWTLRA